MWLGYAIPMSWIKGQLLDVKRYSDGTYDIYELGADIRDAQNMHFNSSWECQDFVSWWYQREAGR